MRELADKVAVVYEDKQISYRELNEKSNQLAHYLRKQGVRGEVLVGLGVERSIEMVIGMMGILKAGGGYVPIDMSYPEERIRYIIEDSKINIILVQGETKDKFRGYKINKLIEIDRYEERREESIEDLEGEVLGDNVVYVIYTSGSTGRPKGVMISNDNFYNLLLWYINSYQIKDNDM